MKFMKQRSTGQKRIIYEKQHHSHRMWVMLLLIIVAKSFDPYVLKPETGMLEICPKLEER